MRAVGTGMFRSLNCATENYSEALVSEVAEPASSTRELAEPAVFPLVPSEASEWRSFFIFFFESESPLRA